MSAASTIRICVVIRVFWLVIARSLARYPFKVISPPSLAEAAFLLARSRRPDAFETPLNFVAEASA